MKILVTGARGFLGRHLVAELKAALEEGARLFALDIPGAPGAPLQGVEPLACDLTDQDATTVQLAKIRFDRIIHLAALVSSCDQACLSRVNVGGTRNLLAALARVPGQRLVLISSAAVYGGPPLEGLPIRETTPVAPVAPYGESVVAREDVACSWSTAGGGELVILRLFNLCGPGQGPTMLIPALARQLARIEAGLQEPVVQVGRLDTRRDYVDVRDAARAIRMAALAPHQPPTVLNVASGRSHLGSDVLEEMRAACQQTVEIRQVQHPERRTDVPDTLGSFAKLHRALGWEPSYDLTASLRDVMAYWRRSVSRGS